MKRTLSGSSTFMLKPVIIEPSTTFSFTLTIRVEGVTIGGLVLLSWTIAVTVVELDTVFCPPYTTYAYNSRQLHRWLKRLAHGIKRK